MKSLLYRHTRNLSGQPVQVHCLDGKFRCTLHRLSPYQVPTYLTCPLFHGPSFTSMIA